MIPEDLANAARAMGVAEGKQNFRDASVIKFHVVDFFSTFFGEWAFQGSKILVHLFPRAGEPDVWYEARYTNNGKTYVQGRKEFCPKGLRFPKKMEAIIKAAANKVTFGDVELTQVIELEAWALRFKDIESEADWIKDGGLLEQFFRAIDEGIEATQ